MSNQYLLARIQSLQNELKELEKDLLRPSEIKKPIVKLQGLWDGITITDEEIESAKKPLFKDADN